MNWERAADLLAGEFPGRDFFFTPGNGMTDAFVISWTDGPTEAQVIAVLGPIKVVIGTNRRVTKGMQHHELAREYPVRTVPVR